MVDDVAHVRLIDAHAEGVGGHEHRKLVVHEVGLNLNALVHRQACMVATRADALVEQNLMHTLNLFARGTVDDAALTLVLAHVIQHELRFLLLGGLGDGKAQVGTVETRYHELRVAQAEQADDVVADVFGGRCGESSQHGALP